ncbi:MAG: NAD(P)/FAD-dependent oxidoreductase [Deltaproteobacteria bacterium]|nr:NAD(P)/FAD-dependent oxidoreductase [Deltaproteobacteria bacterium]
MDAGTKRNESDVVVVGAGHNGLVAAAYLARAGLRVTVLEARGVVGGAAVTEERWPGFKVSTLSYVNSLFRPEIVRDLELAKYGYEMLPREPSSFTPFPDGRFLMLGPDKEMVRREIAKFSAKDAEAYPRYEAALEEIAALIEPLMKMTPPNPGTLGLWGMMKYGWSAFKERARLRANWSELMRLMTGSGRDLLEAWFESEALKVTLATDAIIGANASPSTPGTAYVLFHHVMGECNGVRGVWGYMRGGMGGLTQALARACEVLGVRIVTNAPVAQILVESGAAVGVATTSGDEYRARIVASNADPSITFLKLVGESQLPSDFARNVRRISYDSASVKVNLALSELPDFTACPGTMPGPQHRGTIHIGPTLQYVEEAYADSVAGRPSARPILECTIPSVVDSTVAPPGKHLMNIFVQYGPYKLVNGKTWDELREPFGDTVIDTLEEYAPNIKRAIIHRQVVTPLDMEREYHLTGGNIFHGRMSLDQLFFMRPVPGFADHRTPIRGLYLCGSGAHPGGGVMGTPGLNASREILRDL